jgi:Ca2+-binding EF-hand superfamily protein
LFSSIPPQELAQLQQWFASVDRDRSGHITANELGSFQISGRVLGLDTARQLIKVFDRDYSGSVDFNEFATLNQFILKMQSAFQNADRDRSGYLDATEIHGALTGAGFQLSLPTVQAITTKFAIPQKGVTFDAFLQLCAHLATVRSIFEWNDAQRTGRVSLSYDQLAHITVHVLDKVPPSM